MVRELEESDLELQTKEGRRNRMLLLLQMVLGPHPKLWIGKPKQPNAHFRPPGLGTNLLLCGRKLVLRLERTQPLGMARESLLLVRAARKVFQTPKKEREEAEAPASADEEAVKEKLLPKRYRESRRK
ncbi:hypothetical protein Q9L58_002021 [Maublancomyces gigas]|uniref:Uncharacterized protein n=1 Tax=Discina gigas TaxID=1032678 RepID=A0ABR3GSU3_9PEZI